MDTFPITYSSSSSCCMVCCLPHRSCYRCRCRRPIHHLLPVKVPPSMLWNVLLTAWEVGPILLCISLFPLWVLLAFALFLHYFSPTRFFSLPMPKSFDRSPRVSIWEYLYLLLKLDLLSNGEMFILIIAWGFGLDGHRFLTKNYLLNMINGKTRVAGKWIKVLDSRCCGGDIGWCFWAFARILYDNFFTLALLVFSTQVDSLFFCDLL